MHTCMDTSIHPHIALHCMGTCIYLGGYGDHQPRNNFGMGVSGVALASTVAELCSALVFVALLRRRKLLAPKPTLPATRLTVTMGVTHGMNRWHMVFQGISVFSWIRVAWNISNLNLEDLSRWCRECAVSDWVLFAAWSMIHWGHFNDEELHTERDCRAGWARSESFKGGGSQKISWPLEAWYGIVSSVSSHPIRYPPVIKHGNGKWTSYRWFA